MRYLLLNSVACAILALSGKATAQSSSTSTYVGYNLTLEGDEDSVTYATDGTQAGAAATVSDPDVYLNASLYVGEIDLTVVRPLDMIFFGARSDRKLGQPHGQDQPRCPSTELAVVQRWCR